MGDALPYLTPYLTPHLIPGPYLTRTPAPSAE